MKKNIELEFYVEDKEKNIKDNSQVVESSNPNENDNKKIEFLKKLFSGCKVNFLLGAGFSAKILGVLNDLEDCFNKVQNEDDIFTKNKNIACLYYKFFKKSINPIININKDNYLSVYEIFFQFLYKLLNNRNNPMENKQINIFTTNYDPIIELYLDKLKYNYNDGFVGRICPIFDTKNYGTLFFSQAINSNKKSEIPSFNLFKLHGSVSWNNINEKINYCNYIDKINGFQEKIENLKQEIIEKNEIYNKFINDYEKYFYIINPNKKKFYDTLFESTFYDLLRIFGQELEKENSVLFVFGFSFRDEHINKIIKRATNNSTLKIVIFCYTYDDYKKINDIFEHYNNISFIYPKNNNKVINLNALNNIFSYFLNTNNDKEEENEQ